MAPPTSKVHFLSGPCSVYLVRMGLYTDMSGGIASQEEGKFKKYQPIYRYVYEYRYIYIYIYACVCVTLQGVRIANTLFARNHCVSLACVSCHRNPYSGSILALARPLAHPLSVCLCQSHDYGLSLPKNCQKMTEGNESRTSLGRKSCAIHQMNTNPPHYI